MKVGIIGAGFTGLAAASDLINAGHQVSLYEAADHAGGLAAGFKLSAWDWSLEHFYHHWFASDHAIRDWLQELSLDSNLIFSSPKTAVYSGGRFYPLDSASALLKFPKLSWAEKARFASATAYLKTVAAWPSLEAFTAHDWLIRAYGQRLYGLIWQPLLQGKFGPYSRQVTMAWMWARLKYRTPALGTYRGGFQALIQALCQSLVQRGVDLKLKTPISGIKPLASGFLLSSLSGDFTADAVLITTPPKLTAKLAPCLPPAYLSPLISQPSLAAQVVIFSLKHPLSPEGYYWYNLPKQAGFPFLALVEHTRFVSPKFFGGEHLIYCGDYLTPDHPHFSLPEADLVKLYRSSLTRINPAFKPSWVSRHWLFRAAYAQPVPGVNHSRRLPSVNTPVKGLYLACMAQVYPHDRGTNYAVKLGRRAAALILKPACRQAGLKS